MPSASSQKQIPLRHCVISTLTHSKTQGNMYHDEPILQSDHHQQPQNLAPLEVATTLWPQQTINYWFPNWRELFHGFTVVQGGQPRQAAVSSFEQTQAVTCTQQHARSSASPCSSTQCLHLGTTHRSARLAQQQQISSPLPSSGTNSPHSHLDDATRLPHPTATVAHAAAQSPTLMDRAPKGDAHISCPPSGQAPGTVTKYTIKSPFWLPQGWVTEIQPRRTGSTADKYYKHLVSGRRFRSRNEVLHFISTGKARTRKQDKRKTSLSLTTASVSLMNNFAHKKHTAFAASKLFSRSVPPSSSENQHPTHVGIPLLTERRAELRPNGEISAQSNQYVCLSASSSMQGPESSQLQSTRPVQEKTQKLPVKKKSKTLPLKTSEDKQTSKLWQWFKRPGIEIKACEMAERRNDNDSSVKDMASQKTAQLGREIQAAHRTVVQMSKEMQATAEKLSREIREAQKDVELRSDLKLPGVPAEMHVASIDKVDAGRISRDTEATPRPCTMAGSVVQASHWLHIAADGQAKRPDSAVGYVSHVIQKPDNTKSVPKQGDLLDASPQATNFALNALTQERSFAIIDCMSHVTQPVIWPDIASHEGNQSTQMAFGSHVAKRNVDTSSHPIQPAETAFVTTVNGTQAAQSHAVAPIQVAEAAIRDATRPDLWPRVLTVNVAQPTQRAITEKGTDAKTAERCAFVDGHSPQPSHFSHFELRTRTQAPQTHVVMSSHHSKQPAQVGSVEMADVAQAAQRQMDALCPLLPATETPVSPIGHANAPLHNPAAADALGHVVRKHAGGGLSNPLHAAQVSASCGVGTGMHEEVARQKYQDRKARRLRRKKFAAVLNPKLDLSRLNPALTARQRAKVVQRMKTQHARELLATLGLHLCRKAIRRKPWLACGKGNEI